MIFYIAVYFCFKQIFKFFTVFLQLILYVLIVLVFIFHYIIFSSPEQRSRRAIVLPPTSVAASALASASASTNVKVFVKVFKTSLFPNLIIDLIHL